MYSVAPITIDGVTVGTITFGYEADVPTDALVPGDDPLSLPDSSASGLLGSHGHPHAARHGNSAHSEVSHEHEPVFRHGIGPGSKSRSAEISPHHITTDEVAKALKGESPKHFDVKDVKAALEGKETLKGSAYLKSERQWIADELKKDPQLHRALVALISYEQPGKGDAQRVAESLFNRLNLLRRSEPGLTLREYLSREGKKSFYGPIYHGLTSVSNPRQKGGTSADVIGGDIEGALAGSNLVKGYTDQGSKGDPNYESERASGNYVTSNGELYGDFGGGARAYREDQQRRVAQGGTVATDSDGKPVGVTSLGSKPVGVTHIAGNSALTKGAAGVPSHIIAQAEEVAKSGGAPAVFDFMRKHGYPMNGNWCGEFAASVVKAAGGTPPSGAAVASNWRKWGHPVEGEPQPGDIAVRKGTPIGSTGSHVTIVESVDPTTGKFVGLGGNQGGHARISQPLSGYDFRRGAEEHQDKINPTKFGFPPSVAEFKRLYGRPPTTDREMEAYYGPDGDAADAPQQQQPNLTPLDKLAKLPETEPIARKGAGYVGSAEEAGNNATKAIEEMEDTYGDTLMNLSTGKPTIVWNPEMEKAGTTQQRETLIHEMGHAGVMMNPQLHNEFKKWFAYPNFEELRQRTADVARLRTLGAQLRNSGANSEEITETNKLFHEAQSMQGMEASKLATSMYKKNKQIMSLTKIIRQAEEVNRRANELAQSNEGFIK